jgi:hypothetical protein
LYFDTSVFSTPAATLPAQTAWPTRLLVN